VNLNQMVSRVLRAGRQQSRVESHLKQSVKEIINEAIQEILSYSSEWSFLHKTATLLSIADVNEYALPFNCASLINVEYGRDGNTAGTTLTIFQPSLVARYTQNESPVAATVIQLTESPYSVAGYVYPTWGIKEIVGVQTTFDEEVVGRFFKSEMDGEVYRIATFQDENTITLQNEFGGRHQAGRVKVTGSTDAEKKVVYGNINTTNFAEWMIGRYIQIDGNGSNIFTIVAVDEDRQKLTIDAASNTGNDLFFSVQDNYQIDPPNAPILRLFGTPSVSNENIVIDYYAWQPELTGAFDVPLIPNNYHWLIVLFAQEIWFSENPIEGVSIDRLRRRKDLGIANFLNNEDVIGEASGLSAEPDPVHLKGTNIVG